MDFEDGMEKEIKKKYPITVFDEIKERFLILWLKFNTYVIQNKKLYVNIIEINTRRILCIELREL